MLLKMSDLYMGETVCYNAQGGVADLISDQCSREK